VELKDAEPALATAHAVLADETVRVGMVRVMLDEPIDQLIDVGEKQYLTVPTSRPNPTGGESV
jgi:hypothetical protein